MHLEYLYKFSGKFLNIIESCKVTTDIKQQKIHTNFKNKIKVLHNAYTIEEPFLTVWFHKENPKNLAVNV